MDVPIMLHLGETAVRRERDSAKNGETHENGMRHGASSFRRLGAVRPKLKLAPRRVLYALSLGR
jgi:hypothetical protein